jgi:plastocyanin
MRAITKAGLAAGVATIVAAGCGGSYSSEPAAAPPATGYVITISGMRFSPLDLRAPPGATITVVNRDAEIHSVTSEASPNAFASGAASGVSFDTGTFTGTRQFTLPSNAPGGAVIPYFCSNHREMMVTPNGSITIDPSAGGSSPPPDGGGGGGGGGGPGY